MIQTMRMAFMSDSSVSRMTENDPDVTFLKCRSSVVRNLTLSLASACSCWSAAGARERESGPAVTCV